jgi:hypothetical protein
LKNWKKKNHDGKNKTKNYQTYYLRNYWFCCCICLASNEKKLIVSEEKKMSWSRGDGQQSTKNNA